VVPTFNLRASLVLSAVLCAAYAHAEPPPLAAFARDAVMSDPALSPDGRYLSWLTTVGGVRTVLVKDLSAPQARASLVMSSPPDYKWSIDWCRWATDSRLLCGIAAAIHERDFVYQVTRLAAVDADGKNLKALLQNTDSVATDSQFQDGIIDWTPGKPDTVLLEAQKNRFSNVVGYTGVTGNTTSEYPSIYELNVVTGNVREAMEGHGTLRNYVTDHHGQVRLGWGIVDNSKSIEYDARDPQTGTWRRLSKYEAFSTEHLLNPIAVCVDHPDCAYAIGSSDGRDALWRVDLTGESSPVLEYAHPAVDVDEPVFAHDGRLVGVRYETNLPFIYYTDPTWKEIARGLEKVLPNTFIVIEDASRDEQLFVARASSDVDAGTYYLFDVTKHHLTRIGTAHPDLDPASLPHMQSISYPAQDGTSIPGYLTAPPGVPAQHLPLVVMPHGGPIARDRWDYDFLRVFLASRGYAVLQMNFRGSGGYGDQWFYDAHQDWGGLTYSDIVDGARWAVKQGLADPSKVCIVGWSFGGYAALLAATRNSDLFHCAVSIAGISDLSLLERTQWQNFINGAILREQIGTNSAKLKADSPRNAAASVNIPLLLIHGDNDSQVDVDQSNAMDRALSKANKAHEYILIKGADHQMSRESDRTTLLTAIERFLATSLH
jgi:dienelactone hydrolase